MEHTILAEFKNFIFSKPEVGIYLLLLMNSYLIRKNISGIALLQKIEKDIENIVKQQNKYSDSFRNIEIDHKTMNDDLKTIINELIKLLEKINEIKNKLDLLGKDFDSGEINKKDAINKLEQEIRDINEKLIRILTIVEPFIRDTGGFRR